MLGLAVVLVLAGPARAADGDADGDEDAIGLLRQFDRVEVRERDAADGRREAVVVAVGNVWIEGKDFTLRGSRIVLWCDPSIIDRLPLPGVGAAEAKPDAADPKASIEAWLGPLIRAAYADGGVLYRNDAEDRTLEAERLFLDFERHRGLLHEARARFGGLEQAVLGGRAVIVTAHRIRQLGRRRFEATDAAITTCDFDEPHVGLRVSRTEILQDEETLTWWHDSDSVRVEIGSVPVFWWPGLSGEITSDRPLRPFESASVGQSGRFGFTVETLWGDTIGDRRSDHLDWHLHLDHRWRRGFGTGLDAEYELGDGLAFGQLRSSYQRDRARTDDTTGEPVPRRDRGRLWLQHRFRLDDRWTLDLETHLISDDAYRLEYFEDEAKQDKPAETYGQVAYRGDGVGFWGLVRGRANSWDTQTESFPRLAATLFSYPLAGALFGVKEWALTTDVDVDASWQRRRGDEDLGGHGKSVGRGDVRVALRAPVPIGPVRFTPFIAARGTLYSRTREERDGDERTLVEAGVRADLTLARTWSRLRSSLFDLDGLRHVVHLDLEYVRRDGVSLAPEDLFINDEIDAFEDGERVTLRWRNRFQTRRGESRDTVDALDVELELELYPRRSTVRGERVSGLAFLEGRLRAPLSRDVTVMADLDYLIDGDELLSESVGIEYRPASRVAVYLAQHYVDNRGHRVGAGVEYRPSERWGVRVDAAYDLRRNDVRRAGFSLRRFFHDFVLSLDFSVNRDVDDVRFGVSITPGGLWTGPPAGDGR